MSAANIQQAFDLAVRHHQAGELRHAEHLYRQILAQEPKHSRALHCMAMLALQLGHIDVAIEFFRQAIPLEPQNAAIYTNLAVAFIQKDQTAEAIAACHSALAIKPDYADAYYNLGNALKNAGQFDDAILSYRQAVRINPSFAEALNNLGIALEKAEKLDEAVAAYRSAIEARPGYNEARTNLGGALKTCGRLSEAIAVYRDAIDRNPKLAEAHSNLVFCMHFHQDCDANAIARELSRWSQAHAEPLRKFSRPHSNDRTEERRLRIGYVSPDFRRHVLGYNLLPLLQRHERQQFEITCYSAVLKPDSITVEFQKIAERWRDIRGLSDEAVAAQINNDQIDILVELSLHTVDNRLLVFARKPAPIQVTYLAYCGSSGMSAIDYRFSDPYLDPVGTDLSCYAEKTVRLPRTYWCYQPLASPDPTSPPSAKNGFITFGCLNTVLKVSPDAMALWAEILAALPDSRLILHSPPESQRDTVMQHFDSAGVARDRVRFVGTQKHPKYMLTYGEIDIALDPFPFGGGITTLDALWMGVPVVTLSGKTAVGRGGRSILSNIGLPELIASTREQYKQIALGLARNPPRMNDLRRAMRDRMLASPLLDAKSFARDVEAAYREMWRNWCRS